MAKLQRVLAVLSLFIAPVLFAQSADQEIVSAVDAPDPVTPGSTLTYTVTARNNGPDPAVNGGVNINLPGGVTHTTDTVPAGWTCFWLGSNGSCTTPSFAAGTTEVITINVVVDASLANFADQSITANFYTSGVTPDPNSANNSKSATTLVDSPQVDLYVSATDSPDPVFPDGHVTYAVTVTNGGPDTASNVNFNVVPNSSLSFVSATTPAGWSCTLPPVGSVNATFTCSRATWAPGFSNFQVVFAANDEQFGINDTSFQTNFGVNAGASHETDNSDNLTSVTTAYTTPDADIEISVTDSPDPVFPDGTITYTVTVENNGPDTAPNAIMNVYNSSGLGFVSVTEPAGWNCTEPAPGAFVQFSCSNPSLANGATSVFTVVATTDTIYYGNNEGTISTAFSAGSSISDPNNGNNQQQVDTAYVTPDADLFISATDSPDPVGPDDDITYTVTVTNGGPDSAAATLNVPMNGTLKFTSITIPAGFNCTGVPAAGGSSSFSCTDPTFGSGDSAQFTIVLNADFDAFGNNDQTINQFFGVTGDVTDPDNDDNGVTVSTTYDVANANLGVTATDAPDPVNAGSNITYTGTVTNAGPDTATGVTLTIPLASGLLFQSMTGPSGFSCAKPAVGANGTITCTIASLPNPASIGFTLVAQVNPSLNNGPDGVIEQGFLVGSNTNDPTPANNELDVFTQYRTPDADISVTNSDTPDPVAPGGTITYTQSITNNGPDPAANVTFTETLPASVGFVSIVAAGYSCTTPAVGASGAITCTRASLASGATNPITVVVSVIATSGTVGNTITGDSDTYDPDPTDNSATVSTTILAADSADLSITKNTNTTLAAPGTDIVYTIVLTNNGPDDATAVVVTDTLPAQLQFRSLAKPAAFTCTTPAVGATGTITCNAATLADGATATFTLTARVAPGATSGTITNSASVASATGDPDGGDTSGSAGGVTLAPAIADLSIVKNTASSTAPAGSTFSYTIAVTNNGPNSATNVVMTDVLPAQLLFESIAIPTGFTCTTPAAGTNGTISCNAATLANGVTRTFTLNVRVAAGSTSGTTTNTAGVSSSTADPDGGDTSDPAPPVTLAPASADISITKTTASQNAPVGGTLTYTITVTNAGPSAATGVVVTDTIPAGLQLVTATPSQGTCSGDPTVTCNLGTINNGSNATITLQTLVTATTGTISNTASVTSPVSDPDNGDHSSTTPPIPVGGPVDVAAIPTMSEWALLALAAMLGLLAVMKMKS